MGVFVVTAYNIANEADHPCQDTDKILAKGLNRYYCPGFLADIIMQGSGVDNNNNFIQIDWSGGKRPSTPANTYFTYVSSIKTASGNPLQDGVSIAVDPSVIPFNSWVYIDTIGWRRADDTGGAIQGRRIDLFMNVPRATAMKFGVKNLKVILGQGSNVIVPGPSSISYQPEDKTAPITLTLYVHNGSSSGPIIPIAQVTGQDGSGNSFQQITNSDGYVKITGDEGTWSFTASAEGYETISWTQPISLSGTKHAFLQKSLGGINFTSIKLSYIGVTEDDSGNMKFDYIFKAQKAKGTTDGVDFNAFRGLGLNAFITGLTVPNDKFWVNLMPWEPDRIIDEELSRTDIGRIMLEADLQMKKDFSNYANPCENEQGKTFWNLLDIKREELVQKCMIRYPGEIKNTDNVFFGVVARHWIVPDRVYAYTNDDEIYIINATLAINSEPVTDHASFELKNQDIKDFSKECLEELNRSAREFSEYSKDLEDILILPYVVVDVNHADRYEDLRNVYTALTLAQWYKSKTTAEIDVFREGLGFSDSDSLNASGIWSPREIWEDYVYSFENGEYKCWDNTTTKTAEGTEIKSRLYSAGGVDFLNINDKLVEIDGVPPEIQYQVETAVAKGFVEDGDEVLFGSRVHITRSHEATASGSGSGSGSGAGTGPTPADGRRHSNANGGGNESSQNEEVAQVTCPEGWIGPNEKGECRRYIPLIPMVST